MDLQGKKVIALGERDGIQGTAIANCVRNAGAQVLMSVSYCFV
jgi:betaine reductase